MKIYSYVVARDYGFAPNPYYGYCTLATCKPDIRRNANVSDIIIGTCKTPNRNKICFYMEVSEILTYDEYWQDIRFEHKKPSFCSSVRRAFGDNIYHYENGKWVQEDSHHTMEDGTPSEANITKDTSSDKVLIANNFTYWGKEAENIPEKFLDLIKKGQGYKCNFSEAFISEVKAWLESNSNGVLGRPRNKGI